MLVYFSSMTKTLLRKTNSKTVIIEKQSRLIRLYDPVKVYILHNLLTTIILFLISLINVISASEFEIHVDKQANSMVVLQDKNIIKKYSISIGRRGIGDKKIVGDKKDSGGGILRNQIEKQR